MDPDVSYISMRDALMNINGGSDDFPVGHLDVEVSARFPAFTEFFRGRILGVRKLILNHRPSRSAKLAGKREAAIAVISNFVEVHPHVSE